MKMMMRTRIRIKVSSGILNESANGFPLTHSLCWCLVFSLSLSTDQEGLPIIHIRPKDCTRIKKDNADKLDKYCMQVCNLIDMVCQEEFSWGVVINCAEVSLSDVDLNFIFSILPRLRRYFPNGCKYCVIYGLHWSINAICKVALSAMPADSAKKIRFLRKKDELNALIPSNNLPDFLEGSAILEYSSFPTQDRLKELYGKR